MPYTVAFTRAHFVVIFSCLRSFSLRNRILFNCALCQGKRKPITFTHFRNSGKHNLIVTKFYTNNVTSHGKHAGKCQLNLSTQTIVRPGLVMSSHLVHLVTPKRGVQY